MLHFTHLGTNQVRGSWHRERSLAWNVSLSKMVILLLFWFLFGCSKGLGRWVPKRVADYNSQSHCFAWFCDECKLILIVMNVIWILFASAHLGDATGVARREDVRQEPLRGLPTGDSCKWLFSNKNFRMWSLTTEDYCESISLTFSNELNSRIFRNCCCQAPSAWSKWSKPELGVRQKHQDDLRQRQGEGLSFSTIF